MGIKGGFQTAANATCAGGIKKMTRTAVSSNTATRRSLDLFEATKNGILAPNFRLKSPQIIIACSSRAPRARSGRTLTVWPTLAGYRPDYWRRLPEPGGAPRHGTHDRRCISILTAGGTASEGKTNLKGRERKINRRPHVTSRSVIAHTFCDGALAGNSHSPGRHGSTFVMPLAFSAVSSFR